MTQKQLNRFAAISQVLDGTLSISDAAARLNLSNRQVIRLKNGVSIHGPEFLIHKNSNRQPIHAFSDEFINKIVALKLSEPYKDANFLHFMELLAEHEAINISYNALYTILTDAGIKSPMKRRKTKQHHRRKRKAQEGLLIQMDATPFDWFGNGTTFALHGAIDDATGKVVALFMTKNECLQGYFEITKQIILNHGIPVTIYADRHTIFLSQKASKLSIEDQLAGKQIPDTQFGRALKELEINLIPARSPQAKGRVERLWLTLQSRLPTEFKLHGISSLDQANEFLACYINLFNEKFAVTPADSVCAFRTFPTGTNIDYILCVKHQRIIDNGAVFSYYGKHFKVISVSSSTIPSKAKIDILISPWFGVKAHYKDIFFDTVPFIKPKKINTKSEQSQRVYNPQPDNHYFKHGREDVKKLSYAESDSEILAMLEDILFSKYA